MDNLFSNRPFCSNDIKLSELKKSRLSIEGIIGEKALLEGGDYKNKVAKK